MRRPKSRQNQLKLARKLIGRGDLDAACQILGQPASPVWDGHADTLIIDPGFVHMEGHHANSNLFYRKLLEDRGLNVEILRARRDHVSFARDQSKSRPAFALSAYEHLFPSPLTPKQLRLTNDLFASDFAAVLPRQRPQLTIVHTARHTYIEALSRWLESADAPQPGSLMLGIVEVDAVNPAHPMHDSVKALYRHAFATLQAIPDLKVLVVVETEAVAEFLAIEPNPSMQITIAPYIAGYFDEFSPATADAHDGVLTVGFVGQTRPERGALLIPELAEESIKRFGDAIRWRAQIDIDRIEKHLGRKIDIRMAGLEKSGQFELIGSNLSPPDYYDLLSSIDIMVMPYSERYDTTGSGVGVECLKTGCVQLVPEGSRMHRDAEKYAAGCVTFSDLSINSTANAIGAAIADFDSLNARSRTASTRLDDDNTLSDVIAFLDNI